MVKQYRAKTRKPKMRKTKGKKPTRKINLGKKKKTMRKRRRNGGAPTPNILDNPDLWTIITAAARDGAKAQDEYHNELEKSRKTLLSYVRSRNARKTSKSPNSPQN